MIHHVSIGVSDVAMARRFYDAALAPLGVKCLSEDASALGYGGSDGPRLWLLAAGAAVPRDIPGLHICLEAGKRAAVDAVSCGRGPRGRARQRQAGTARRLRRELLRRLRHRSRRQPDRSLLRPQGISGKERAARIGTRSRAAATGRGFRVMAERAATPRIGGCRHIVISIRTLHSDGATTHA